MKSLLLTILSLITISAFAQPDTSKTVSDTGRLIKTHSFHFTLKHKRDTVMETPSKAPGFSWGIVFTRIDFGLTTLRDNNSFKLSPQNEFLRYRSWKSSNVGFDVFQMAYRFNSSFKFYVAAGFDWELIRLRNDITIQKTPDRSGLYYTNDAINYNKNRFSSSYLRIPIMFDFRSKDNDNGTRWHYVLGPELGVLLSGKVKQVSDENGKQKMFNNYHFTRFRYGAVIRVGHGFLGVFGKYYFNDMFNTVAQKGLKNISFGFTAGF